MSATSPYLNAPPRSLVEVLRIRAAAPKPAAVSRRGAILLAGDAKPASAAAPGAEGQQ